MNIYDIAKRCGVSTATVSRVINNSPRVSDRTRSRVLAVIEEEGYTPNAFARGLGLDTMGMVGLLCTDVSDLYYARAVSLIESALREQGRDALLCCTGNELSEKQKYLELLLRKRVDAVILIGSSFRENRDNSHIQRAAGRVPVVIVNGLVEMPGVYCVVCDERSAVRENVHRMYRQGIGDILYLYDSLNYSGTQKLEGYRAGLRECGIPERESLICRVEKGLEPARRAVEAVLDKGVPFSGVMASEDLLAVGAQKALTGVGKACPVIGFNNSLTAQCSTPALTSVDNMLDTLCPTAVNLLMDVLSGKEAPEKIVVSARLAQGETFRVEQPDAGR